MDTLIEGRDLVRLYPGVRAVDGISLQVSQGQCLGLLGPNGAGKTTTLEMLEDIQTPSREFYRDHAGLGWNIFMPVLMVLAFAFSGPPEDLLKTSGQLTLVVAMKHVNCPRNSARSSAGDPGTEGPRGPVGHDPGPEGGRSDGAWSWFGGRRTTKNSYA